MSYPIYISNELNSIQTIDCLNDILMILQSLRNCISSSIENLSIGTFESTKFVIQMEDFLNDLNDLMSAYQSSIQYKEDIDFQYISLLSIWKGIIVEYAGQSIIWCMRHQMPLQQLIASISAFQDMLLKEIKN